MSFPVTFGSGVAVGLVGGAFIPSVLRRLKAGIVYLVGKIKGSKAAAPPAAPKA